VWLLAVSQSQLAGIDGSPRAAAKPEGGVMATPEFFEIFMVGFA